MQPEDPNERIAELERELAEAKHTAAQEQAAARQEHQRDSGTDLARPPRAVPTSFLLAEALPFRWWYIWTLFMVAITPIALWAGTPLAFAIVAVLTLAAIYAYQLSTSKTRLALLTWGVPATVVDSEIVSRGTYYSGTTYYNVFLPVAHGWTVTRARWSGPSTKTRVRYVLGDYRGEITVKGREYVDGVILVDQRDPSRALCITDFAYDLDRDASGNWVGNLRTRLKVGMAVWFFVIIGWLALAGFAVVQAR